jgi:hypothetical protein
MHMFLDHFGKCYLLIKFGDKLVSFFVEDITFWLWKEVNNKWVYIVV